MSRDSGESVADTVLQAVTLSLILAVGVVLNAVVLGVFCSSRSLRSTRHSMFVINLIFCDVIFLLSVMPLSLVDVVCPDVCVSVLREGMLCQVSTSLCYPPGEGIAVAYTSPGAYKKPHFDLLTGNRVHFD